jgi:glucan biosynthesis protein C
MLTAIPLLTLPQFIMLQYVKGKAENWPNLSLYEKYNTLVWELVSHLWFLLVLVVLTTVSLLIFSRLRHHLSTKPTPSSPTLRWANCRCSFCCWVSLMPP